jgi:hypothetical protein
MSHNPTDDHDSIDGTGTRTRGGEAGATADETAISGTTAVKQPYVPPQLVTYGDVTEMTQSRNRGRRRDGAIKGKTRTR